MALSLQIPIHIIRTLKWKESKFFQISAQESRRKKKEFVDTLERRVEEATSELVLYKKRCEILAKQKAALAEQVKNLKNLIEKQVWPLFFKQNSFQILFFLVWLSQTLCYFSNMPTTAIIKWIWKSSLWQVGTRKMARILKWRICHLKKFHILILFLLQKQKRQFRTISTLIECREATALRIDYFRE